MTTTITDGPPCPTCSGRQMAGHPCGMLAWRHDGGCALRASEDGQHVADLETLGDGGLELPGGGGSGRFERPTTATERTLLAALGHPLPVVLSTVVESLSPHVLYRSWPALGATP